MERKESSSNSPSELPSTQQEPSLSAQNIVLVHATGTGHWGNVWGWGVNMGASLLLQEEEVSTPGGEENMIQRGQVGGES